MLFVGKVSKETKSNTCGQIGDGSFQNGVALKRFAQPPEDPNLPLYVTNATSEQQVLSCP